eukprot:3377044-Ditylum_brightwellii.AAC.1
MQWVYRYCKDIVYEDNTSPSHIAKFIIVDFGSKYTGTAFFPDDDIKRGWGHVHPVMATWYTPSRTLGQYDKTLILYFLCNLFWLGISGKLKVKQLMG